MKQQQAVEKISQALIESWNDSNPVHRLNGELIEKFKEHLQYAYVTGVDDLAEKMLRILKNDENAKKHTISIRYLQDQIKTFEP